LLACVPVLRVILIHEVLVALGVGAALGNVASKVIYAPDLFYIAAALVFKQDLLPDLTPDLTSDLLRAACLI
jgi:hypothetical protein